MWRGRKCCVNCSALLLSVLDESLPLIVAELGLAFLATCNVLSRKLFSRVSMAVSSDSIGTDAKLSPVLEKEGIFGNTTGDVSFPEWAEGNGLAIDVAVTSPLAPSSLRSTEPCESLRQRSTQNMM